MNIQGARRVKDIVREPFVWPGGYEKFAVTSDGACICRTCCRDNFKLILHSTMFECADGWQVDAVDATCNVDGPLNCDHCGNDVVDSQ